VTDWDVVDATPYGKDLIGPLAEAARAEGLRFGLYYSQAQDWTHPGGAKSGHEEGEGWDELHKGDFDEYLGQIAIPQVGEILSRYRPDILWWDTPRWMTEERAERLIPLVRIVPGIILNNRLGGGYRGDTETPEQHIPATGFKDRDWEVCMTMNGTWGYKSYDHNWKSTKDLIHKLCDIVSKGGNFLLNVGPIAEGLIPQPSVERLEEIGAWMDVNGESIYGTTASPFHRLTWGRCTKKEHPGGTTLYLHVFDWPDDGRLVVPGLKSVPVSTRLLQDGKAFAAEPVVGAEPGLAIMVPNAAPDPIASVIRLEVEGELDVEPIMPRQSADGAVELEPAFADLHNRLGSQLQLESKSRKINIGHWTDARAWVGWTFQISQPATFNVQVEMASEKDSNLTFGLRNQPKTRVALGATEGYGDFQARELGTLEIPATGTYTLELQPVKQEWSPINLRSVSLRPRK
jgi:alpha-L-fucosidase